MVHNAVHHAFFITLSILKNVHQKHYDELLAYLKQFGIYYGIKAEDVDGEGKVHLHGIHIRDFEEQRPYDKDRKIDMFGPRRADDTKKHIKLQCPQINLSCTSTYSLRVDVLTSSQWVEYLNKETHMNAQNFPEDFCLVSQYFSEKTITVSDPEMAADAKKYSECVGVHDWAIDPSTHQSCRRFYRYFCNKLKEKRTLLDDGTKNCPLYKKATKLVNYMNESVYSDDDEPPKKKPKPTKYQPGMLTQQLHKEIFGTDSNV